MTPVRMRKRPNLAPRMESCVGLLIENPSDYAGRWLERCPNHSELWLEIGCGKGRFTADVAEANQDAMLLAVERVPDAMVIAMERCRDREIKNVRFIDGDAARLPELFGRAELSRIYINFCDPWPKSRDAKFRLTAPAFLRLYADALCDGGEIRFKTDNRPLFDWSVEQLTAERWQLEALTYDLHANGTVGIMTDYEAKFCAEGLKINSLTARRTGGTLTTAAGQPPRLRNASLSDARGFAASSEVQT